jgi:hypothetical protein
MPVPRHIAKIPGAGQASKMIRRLEQGDLLATLSKAMGKRHPEKTTTENGPTFGFRRHFSS